ncbi:MAG TPA: cyclic nucleotide-binding domain-containing protein [Streptosporangiaceae bacterium]|nr:cyclic nucleotide-binding domain-containing protein [Streptosporangiaceae bacterium]
MGEERLVGALPPLRGLSPEQIARLTAAARHVSLPRHHRLFEEEAPADRFWIVDAGQVALDVLVPGVGRLIIETLGRGDVVGLSWLVPPYQWQFGAVCTQPLQAFEFDARAVRAACAADPDFGYAIALRFMTAASHRLQATRSRLLQVRSATA